MRSSLVVIALMLLSSESVPAQAVLGEGRPIERGARIRIAEAARQRRLEGVLVEWRGDSALARIDASGAYLVVPPDLVGRIEVYDGKRSRAGKGARIGALAGLSLGALVVLSAAADPYKDVPAGQAIAFVGMSTATYAGIGALIGSFVKVPRWRQLQPEGRVQAVVGPRGRVGLAISSGF